jgi:hypothetical protein
MADILIFQKDTDGCFVYWPFHAPVHAPVHAAMDSLPEAGTLGLRHN